MDDNTRISENTFLVPLGIGGYLLTIGIANRLKPVLASVMSEDHKRFLRGPYIGENTRAVYDILHAAKLHTIPGILLVDFQKAFDSVSLKFLYKCLIFFNFRPDFVRWMNDDTQLCVNQNGFFSQFLGIDADTGRGPHISIYLQPVCRDTSNSVST